MNKLPTPVKTDGESVHVTWNDPDGIQHNAVFSLLQLSGDAEWACSICLSGGAHIQQAGSKERSDWLNTLRQFITGSITGDRRTNATY